MATLKFATIFLTLVLWGLQAKSSPWGLQTGSAGYLGEIVVGAYYKFNNRHEVDFSLGSYTLDDTHFQINLAYLYTPFEKDLGAEDLRWSVVDFGASLSFALDRDNYFLRSPVQYPQSNYYDHTRDRVAFQVGTALYAFKDQISVRYFVSLLTIEAIAFFNNREGYNQFLSSGITMKMAL